MPNRDGKDTRFHTGRLVGRENFNPDLLAIPAFRMAARDYLIQQHNSPESRARRREQDLRRGAARLGKELSKGFPFGDAD